MITFRLGFVSHACAQGAGKGRGGKGGEAREGGGGGEGCGKGGCAPECEPPPVSNSYFFARVEQLGLLQRVCNARQSHGRLMKQASVSQRLRIIQLIAQLRLDDKILLYSSRRTVHSCRRRVAAVMSPSCRLLSAMLRRVLSCACFRTCVCVFACCACCGRAQPTQHGEAARRGENRRRAHGQAGTAEVAKAGGVRPRARRQLHRC